VAVEPIRVELKSTVKGAVVVDGTRELSLPTTIEITKGSPRSVTVKAEGYEPAEVSVDGATLSLDVPLKQKAKVNAQGPTPRATPARPPAATVGPVDPWGGPSKVFGPEKK